MTKKIDFNRDEFSRAAARLADLPRETWNSLIQTVARRRDADLEEIPRERLQALRNLVEQVDGEKVSFEFSISGKITAKFEATANGARVFYVEVSSLKQKGFSRALWRDLDLYCALSNYIEEHIRDGGCTTCAICRVRQKLDSKIFQAQKELEALGDEYGVDDLGWSVLEGD